MDWSMNMAPEQMGEAEELMPPIFGEAVWSDEMKKTFGSPGEGQKVPPLKTVEEIRKAMLTLFWFRE